MGIIRESLKERELHDFRLTRAQVADAYERALEDVKERYRGEEMGGNRKTLKKHLNKKIMEYGT